MNEIKLYITFSMSGFNNFLHSFTQYTIEVWIPLLFYTALGLFVIYVIPYYCVTTAIRRLQLHINIPDSDHLEVYMDFIILVGLISVVCLSASLYYFIEHQFPWWVWILCLLKFFPDFWRGSMKVRNATLQEYRLTH